jgi:hypothetical protein
MCKGNLDCREEVRTSNTMGQPTNSAALHITYFYTECTSPITHLAESVSTRRPKRRRCFVFPLLLYPVGLRHGLVAGRSWIVGCLRTGGSHVVCGILESGHVRSLQAGVVARGRCGCRHRLPPVLGFLSLELGLTLNFGIESRGTVGVDGLFGKVVSPATGWRLTCR